VSSLAGLDCPRRVMLYLLSTVNELEADINFNGYLLAGSILHDIIQSLYRRGGQIVSALEYHLLRNKHDLEDSILIEMNQAFDKWTAFVTSDKFPYASKTDDISIALDRTESQLPYLARMAKTLVHIDSEKISSRSIADEFIVQTLLSNFLLVGHIDLVALKPGGFRLIELKTGKPKKMDHTQLQLYGDIVQSADPNIDICLELWYSNSGDILEVESSNGAVLESINKLIRELKNIKSLDDLPKHNYYAEDCRYCNYCKDAERTLVELSKKEIN
jgi:hypothetical protein